MLTLSMLQKGEKAIVDGFLTESHHHHRRHQHRHHAHNQERMDGEGFREFMERIGINIGKTVEMMQSGQSGPVLIKIDDNRIAVGRRMAMKVMVRKVNE